MRNTRTFSDLDLRFISHPLSHDIVKTHDEAAIKQSVKNLIMTQNYERLFHPEVGSQVMSLLFENSTPLTQNVLQRTIIYTIENFEPRVNLISVDVDLRPDSNAVQVSITFKIINTETPLNIDLTLYRAR